MSHYTSIKTQIKDIGILENTCRDFGIDSLLRHTKARGYGSQSIECDYCIRWEGSPYDVAVVRQQDGTYSLTGDFYQGHIAQKFGHPQGKTEMELNLGRLLQAYAKHTVLQQASQNNLGLLSQENTDDGRVILRLMAYSS